MNASLGIAKKGYKLTTIILCVSLVIGGILYYLLGFDLGEMTIAEELPWYDYFFNNIVINLIIFIGFLTYGAISLGLVFINGLTVGYVLMHALNKGIFWDVFLLLAPHGILEFISVVIACSSSITIIRYIKMRIRKVENTISTKDFLRFLSISLGTVTVLNILAGLVEQYVTITI